MDIEDIIARAIQSIQPELEDPIDMQLSTESLEEEVLEKPPSKFQKEISFNKLLPYADKLDEEADIALSTIKANLGRCIMTRDIKPGAIFWFNAFQKYMLVHGLRITKDEHVAFIKLLYELITIPNLESTIVQIFCSTLIVLLKKKEILSQQSIEIPWRPLYKLCEPVLNRKPTQISLNRYYPLLESTLESLVYAAKYYFPLSATQEILEEIRPKLCPYDSRAMFLSIKIAKWFLPVSLPPENHKIGHQLWFNEFMNIWQVCHNAPVWENEMMWLMAKLATRNIGYIDWEPFIPIMFTRFVRCLNLPVNYKKTPGFSHHKMEMSPIGEWIVSVLGNNSSAQSYLEKFLKTIETYFHPANFGSWLRKLEDLFVKICYHFVERLHRERYAKKRTWQNPIPESHKLSDEEVNAFVSSIMPIAMTAVFNKRCTQNFCFALQYLSTLRPSLVIPCVLEKVYPSLGADIEPHKLITAMICMVSISKPLVQGSRNVNKDYAFHEGPSHALSLLFSALPGIDPNDPNKCFAAFRLITTFGMLIPFVDCSKSNVEMTDDERLVCEETSKFEDFILQFMDKIFVLIESSSLEFTRLESTRSADSRKSAIEAMSENSIYAAFTSLLLQASDEIFQTALTKLRTFVTENTLEPKVAGPLVGILCKVFSRINPTLTLHALLPFLTEKILNDIGENDEILKEDHLDNQFLYSLLLLHRVVETQGTALLPHMDDLIKIVDKVIHLKSVEGNQLGCQLLKNILSSLCTVTAVKVDKDFNDQNYPYIRDWGESVKINSTKIKWYVPEKDELDMAQKLFNRYFPPAIESIENYINSKGKSLTNFELQTTLRIVSKILEGCDHVLPLWKEPPKVVKPFENCLFEIIPEIGIKGEITMADGSNVKKFLCTILGNLQDVMLKMKEDDTKSLLILSQIWHNLILGKLRFSLNLDVRRRHFRLSKKSLEDKLVGNKGYLPLFLMERVEIQHEFRKVWTTINFTETHETIMMNLLQLSTSQYSQIRSKAQSTLNMAIEYYPFSYLILKPRIIEILGRDTEREHDAYKGVLYLILSDSIGSLVVKKDWQFLQSLWPALVLSQPSEKPSVIRLKDYIVDSVSKNYVTSNIVLEIPDTCIKAAKDLWKCGIKPSLPEASGSEIKVGLDRLIMRGKENLESYNDILDKLLNAILENNLHWRHRLMAMNLISVLIHPDYSLPPKIVRYFFSALVHESIEERKIALKMTTCILKQLKRKHRKVKINPDDNNTWVKYSSEKNPKNSDDWDKVHFIDKQYMGYYTWPNTVEVYAPTSEQPTFDLKSRIFSTQENEINLFFNDKENINKLIKYLSLEEKKGRDKFNFRRILLFKGLFRNYGDAHLEHFIPHLQTLVSDKQESMQRCAAEITCGLIRGSKHWTYQMTSNMWCSLLPIVRTVLSNLTVETITDWAMCFSNAHKDRDPQRVYWLLECLMEEPPLGQNEVSFVESGRLLILQSALSVQSWKVDELFNRLLLRFENRLLENPFQNVRDRLASILVSIFQLDFQFKNNGEISNSGVINLIEKVYPKIHALIDEDESVLSLELRLMDVNGESTSKPIDEEREKLLRLFKTICKWMYESVVRSLFGGLSTFYKITPLTLQLENYEKDEELSKACTRTLAVLAQAFTLPEHIPKALDAIDIVSKSNSWSARSSCAEFLQVFVFHNMSILLSQAEWIDKIQKIVLRLLEDENVQVREKAAQVLGGLLHCTLLPNQKELLTQFKTQARTKLHKKHTGQRNAEMVNAIRLRHAGVLGMCAFINAHPYDVPEFIPPIFECLGAHLSDPEPIPTTIRKILNDFKRTHCDGWTGLQGLAESFTEDQYAVLQDITVPPSYYA